MNRVSCLFILAAAATFSLFILPPLLPLAFGSKIYVPPELEPWKKWVLYGHEDLSCPVGPLSPMRQCLWPISIKLDVDKNGARFKQKVYLFKEGDVRLPGNDRFWPNSLEADGHSIPVFSDAGKPIARLPSGYHIVSGKLPALSGRNTIPIPEGTALVTLNIDGKNVENPKVDSKKWLLFLHASSSSKATAPKRKETIKIETFRLLEDDVPFFMEGLLRLSVSGTPRQLVLKDVIPPGFLPVQIDFPMAAGFSGRHLVLQVRPGLWQLRFRARSKGPVDRLKLWPRDPRLGSKEIWAFKPDTALRQVEISGALSIDPSQSDAPTKWRTYPLYLVKEGQGLSFKVIRRGDPNPAPNRLNLQRRLWLNFSGKEYTFQDHIKGQMHRRWRMDLLPPFSLGKVAVNGRQELITVANDGRGAGVEVRYRDLDMVAEGLISGTGISTIGVTGWKEDFDSVKTSLFLPPGWRVLAVSGADITKGTWLDGWSLLDLFMVLVVSMAVLKVFGWSWAMVALFVMVITVQDHSAPGWLWINPVAAAALLMVVKSERAKRRIRLFQLLSGVAILVVLVPYLADQARTAIYPQLGFGQVYANVDMPQPEPVNEQLKQKAPGRSRDHVRSRMDYSLYEKMARPGKNGGFISSTASKEMEELLVDPDAKVQTGPGIPLWHSRPVTISWSGPVRQGQAIRIFYLSPMWETAIRLLKLPLCMLLLLAVTGLLPKRQSGCCGQSKKMLALLLPAAMISFCSMLEKDASAAPLTTNVRPQVATSFEGNVPGPDILEELEARLIRPPKCAPNCAHIESMAIDVTSRQVLVRIRVASKALSYLKLPVNCDFWQPEEAKLEQESAHFQKGAKAQATISKGYVAIKRLSDGSLAAQVPEGVSDLLLSGPLSSGKELIFPIDGTLHNVSVKAGPEWSISGIDAMGNGSGQIRLLRADTKKETDKSLSPMGRDLISTNQIPAFVRIERRFVLGRKWKIYTRVIRASAFSGPILLEYPLLPGEHVTSSRVKTRQVQARSVAVINMPQGSKELSWTSALDLSDLLVLKACHDPAIVEVWSLKIGTMWRFSLTGLPPLSLKNEKMEARLYQSLWKPWPGEELKISLSRPRAKKGHTLTVDSCTMSQRPGKRSTETRLKLHLLSSLGGYHELKLPQGARLQEFLVDGKPLSFDPNARKVAIPLHPGTIEAGLSWREEKGIAAKFSTTPVELGLAMNNLFINLDYPQNRWVLFVGGPRLGPAVLFWGVLAVAFFCALGLGRIKGIPLSTMGWMILGAGMMPVSISSAFIVTLWLIALYLRETYRDRIEAMPAYIFNLIQAALVIFTFTALSALVYSVQQGLLGYPDMQIAGNGSYPGHLSWYHDRADVMPVGWLISLPLWVYRCIMLLWALWLSFSLMRWLAWGWKSFSAGCTWKRPKIKVGNLWIKGNKVRSKAGEVDRDKEG